ncbi:MAG: GNAT family N-acetyltransferase [Acetobacteraceae bacterium]
MASLIGKRTSGMLPYDGRGLSGAQSAPLPVRVILRPAHDENALCGPWRELEARSDCSFFQSWTYTGCLMAERFPDPVVLEAFVRTTENTENEAEERVALALFNRRRGRLGIERLRLGESGIPSFDTLFIEHNGPLVARGFVPSLLPKLVHAALHQPVGPAPAPSAKRVVSLSGVGGDVLAAARSAGAVINLEKTRLAPALDVAGLRRKGIGHLDCLSANTRYQLRRTLRRFAASGPLSVRRAASPAEAHAWLDALAKLHQRTWEGRGQRGAFAEPDFQRFHHALIDRGLPRREVDVLEVRAGPECLGYLLNFVFHGTVYAYQSGFDYALAGRHQKPGLTCHHLAIEMYLREGVDRYDFLGGAERYKLSLSDASTPLHWMSLAPRWSAAGGLLRLSRAHQAISARLGRHGRRNP